MISHIHKTRKFLLQFQELRDAVAKQVSVPEKDFAYSTAPPGPSKYKTTSEVPLDTHGEAGIRFNLGQLYYTAEELIAISIVTKLAGGESDASFQRHMQNFVTGLTDPEDLKELEEGKVVEPELSSLPGRRYQSDTILSREGVVAIHYVLYCCFCFTVIDKFEQKPKKAVCTNPKCKKSLTKKLAEGNCYFISMSIKDQLEQFLKQKRFQRLLRKYSNMHWAQMQGILHKGLIQEGHFDLTMGIDGAQMHNKMGLNVLPAVFFINNIPVSLQLRYPILGAVWTGKPKIEPERFVFLKYIRDELEELSTTPITWKDDLGEEHDSLVFLTTVESDAPEKSKLMNQKGHSGFYSCPFCTYRGKTITSTEYPKLFKQQSHHVPPKEETLGGGPRFPDFIHEERCPWRNGEERYTIAKRVLEEQRLRNDPEYTELGIKGHPALHTLEHFNETDSHVCDTLHVICLGVCETILDDMVTGPPTRPTSFLNRGGNWNLIKKLQDSMTRVSESNRNPRHFDVYTSEWKGYDKYQFLLHQVALLCSDEEIIMATNLYECLVHLSNIVFYSHYGRLTEEIIQRVEKEIEAFSVLFRTIYTVEKCSFKLHMLQHFPDILRRHGPAYYTDGFHLERFISMTKKLTTTNKAHMKQLARNFLLRFHNPHLRNMDQFGPHAKLALRGLGVDDDFLWCFEDNVLATNKIQNFEKDSPIPKLVKDFLQTVDFVKETSESVQDIFEKSVRVEKMNRKSIILETRTAYHREGSKMNDSLIQLNGGEAFGQIQEILHFPKEDKYIVVMNKFQKIYPVSPNDDFEQPILYPDNQFPFREPLIPDYHVFLIEDDTFILKAQVGTTSYHYSGSPVQLFTVRPNEWFRF
jgi:hypothetical protein